LNAAVWTFRLPAITPPLLDHQCSLTGGPVFGVHYNQQIDNNDADYRRMLEQVSVMEYLNGGDDDAFAAAEPWYAVNPIVRELSQFKLALTALDHETPP
jgi:hypothetical protein